MKKALLLLSGGQDSTTCLFWAKKKFSYLKAIGFDYGQRHIKELKYARKICKRERIKFDIIKYGNKSPLEVYCALYKLIDIGKVLKIES